MDLNPIGRHCTLASCNILDFLPLQCSCLLWFCKLHISPDLHHCTALRQHPSNESSSTRPRPECTLSGCHKLSLGPRVTPTDSTQAGESRDAVPNGCPGCHLSFCVDHRHMQSHSCTGLDAGKSDAKYEAARALLAQNFPATGASTSHTPVVARQHTNVPSDPQKLAQLQKVLLMKLRHKATPADPKDKGSTVPIDQRIHVTVRLESLSQPPKEIVLWFRKTTITGKALDLIIQRFSLSRVTSALQLKNLSVEAGSRTLRNHLELSAQLEDGSTVVLTDLGTNA